MTKGDVSVLVNYFANGHQIDDSLIQLLVNVRDADDDNCYTPELGTPNNSPLLGGRRGFAMALRGAVTSPRDKSPSSRSSESSSSSRLSHVSPSFGASSQSPLVRRNSHMPQSPMAALALARCRAEKHQTFDGECD